MTQLAFDSRKTTRHVRARHWQRMRVVPLVNVALFGGVMASCSEKSVADGNETKETKDAKKKWGTLEPVNQSRD